MWRDDVSIPDPIGQVRALVPRSPPLTARAFTLIEVTAVLILVAVMAVFIAPRLQTTKIDQLGFYQNTLAAIRYAHKVAIASGCSVRVTVSGTGVSLTYAGAPAACGTAAVTNPATGAPFVTSAPTGVTVAGATFVYDLIGDPSLPQDLTITNPDTTTYVIRVTDETGFAFTP